MNSVDEAYFAAAQGGTPSRSAKLPSQVRAFIGLLVVVALAKQQQLRAPGQAARPPLSPKRPTPGAAFDAPVASQRTIAVQKFAAQSNAYFDAALRNRALQPVLSILDPLVENVGTIAKGALGAATLAGTAALAQGFAAGAGAFGSSLAASAGAASSAVSTAATALGAIAPAAVPLAAAGIIGSIIGPAIASGQFFSGSIDPYFDATTAAATKRAAAQAALIRQDLATTGLKFARRSQTSFDLLGG